MKNNWLVIVLVLSVFVFSEFHCMSTTTAPLLLSGTYDYTCTTLAFSVELPTTSLACQRWEWGRWSAVPRPCLAAWQDSTPATLGRPRLAGGKSRLGPGWWDWLPACGRDSWDSGRRPRHRCGAEGESDICFSFSLTTVHVLISSERDE